MEFYFLITRFGKTTGPALFSPYKYSPSPKRQFMTMKMQTVGFWYFVLFSLVRSVCLAYRSLIWWLQGLTRLYHETYEKSARVERIVWRSKACMFSPIKPWHFIGVHETFEHPDFVLRDDVVLCSLTTTEAMFIQIPSNAKNYAGDRCPFLWITLFEKGVRTIVMPLSSLIRLAETDDRVSSFKMKSMIISNSGRCGSTLLAKMVQLANDRVLVLSETDTMQCIHEYTKRYQKMYGQKEFLRILRSAMLLQFKPVQDVDAIVLKIRMTGMRVVRYVYGAAPEIRHVYIQRQDRLKTIQSWERAFGIALEARLLSVACRLGLAPIVVRLAYHAEEDQMRVINGAIKHLKWTMFETFTMVYADNLVAYEHCRDNYGMETIYYEEMTADPIAVLDKTFRILGVQKKNGKNGKNGTHMEHKVLNGMKDDSQKGTILSMEELDSRKATPLTPELKKRLNAYMNEVGMPLFE